MSATVLKIIAVICMTLDHLSTFLGAPLPLRYVGRIAAVIFFFCAAESAVHTHDRRKYLLRLYKMSLLMTALSVVIPFILNGWFPGRSFRPPGNNIFTELLPGVWIIDILESTRQDPARRKKRLRSFILYQLATIPIGLALSMLIGDKLHVPDRVLFWPLGSLFMSEGNLWLTLMIPLFYALRGSKKKLTIGYTVYCALYAAITVPQLPARFFRFFTARAPLLSDAMMNMIGLLGFDPLQQNLSLSESLLQYNFQCFMILALPLLLLYNGERGKGYKRFFYIYYPAHIYVLYILSHFLQI
ncbi:MAG: hypothetical protein IKS42_01240 [Oscillospiraceae bacterium]|nr:hypothetical protein [Oscillospiraceae bacterium]